MHLLLYSMADKNLIQRVIKVACMFESKNLEILSVNNHHEKKNSEIAMQVYLHGHATLSAAVYACNCSVSNSGLLCGEPCHSYKNVHGS
jgi:hypothetical protein